ncbi:hypothetical protein RUM43_008102 [Polyplax serrata]|uniref:Uncharacterized protein n=1 Tax=Polyplax serrata TaxID=468196 RepID=A0AAN8S888_POLSC
MAETCDKKIGQGKENNRQDQRNLFSPHNENLAKELDVVRQQSNSAGQKKRLVVPKGSEMIVSLVLWVVQSFEPVTLQRIYELQIKFYRI